jgi:hypothetical protein
MATSNQQEARTTAVVLLFYFARQHSKFNGTAIINYIYVGLWRNGQQSAGRLSGKHLFKKDMWVQWKLLHGQGFCLIRFVAF